MKTIIMPHINMFIQNRNTFFRRALCLLALLTFVLTLLPNALAAKTAPKSVTLDLHEIEIDLADSDTFTLHASVLPEGADDNYKWISSNKNIVSVSGGQVRCLKQGQATITVSIHGHSDVKDSCVVRVTDSRAPERIIAYPSRIETEPGMEIKLECVVMPQSADATLEYRSSNTSVATVDENGVISVLSPGKTTIYARSPYDTDVYCEVRLLSEYGERAQRVRLNDTSLKLERGESYRLHAEVDPEGASKALVYTSSDESIVSVDQNGVVTALRYGVADITVYSYRDSSVMAGLPVSVTDVLRPETIEYTLSGEPVLKPGERLTLDVKVSPETALTDYVITSSREDIVSISQNTLIARKTGISYIRVQSSYREDLYTEFKITVDDGSGALVMPLRRTSVQGIDDNLAAIERIKSFALESLNALYNDGRIGQEEYNRRTEVIGRAFDMYAFPWTVDEPIKYWKSENSENGAKDFKPGTIYYGLPYTSGENHNRAYNVTRALDQGRYFAVDGQKYYVMNPNNDNYAQGYAGNDCSAFVAQALWGYTVYGDIVKTETLIYDKRLHAVDDANALKAGDLLVRYSEHVVMFLYWTDEEHTQAVFIQQGGSEPAINTVNATVEEISTYLDNNYRMRRLAEY